MDECYFAFKYHCKSDQSNVCTDAGPKRIKTIIEFSLGYGDEIDRDLQAMLDRDSSVTLKCHRKCVSTYTSKTHLKRHLKRTSNDDVGLQVVPPKRGKRSETTSFAFKQHCVFCGEDCSLIKDQKNPGRWRVAYLCKTADKAFGDHGFKQTILKKCQVRQDKLANDVRGRVEGEISDLHAADARYHKDCMNNFMSPRSVKAAATATSSQSTSAKWMKLLLHSPKLCRTIVLEFGTPWSYFRCMNLEVEVCYLGNS